MATKEQLPDLPSLYAFESEEHLDKLDSDDLKKLLDWAASIRWNSIQSPSFSVKIRSDGVLSIKANDSIVIYPEDLTFDPENDFCMILPFKIDRVNGSFEIMNVEPREIRSAKNFPTHVRGNLFCGGFNIDDYSEIEKVEGVMNVSDNLCLKHLEKLPKHIKHLNLSNTGVRSFVNAHKHFTYLQELTLFHDDHNNGLIHLFLIPSLTRVEFFQSATFGVITGNRQSKLNGVFKEFLALDIQDRNLFEIQDRMIELGLSDSI